MRLTRNETRRRAWAILPLLTVLGLIAHSAWAQAPGLRFESKPKQVIHQLGIVTSMAISPNGKSMIVGLSSIGQESVNGQLTCWDTSTRKRSWSLQTVATVNRIRYSYDGKKIGLALIGGQAQIRNAKSGELLLRVKADNNNCHSIAFAPDDKSFATGGRRGIIRTWNMQGRQSRSFGASSPGPVPQVLDLAFLSDGSLISCGTDRKVYISSFTDGIKSKALVGHSAAVNRITLIGKDRFATGAEDGTIFIWDKTGKLLRTLDVPSWRLADITATTDGKWLFAVGKLGDADITSTVVTWSPDQAAPEKLTSLDEELIATQLVATTDRLYLGIDVGLLTFKSHAERKWQYFEQRQKAGQRLPICVALAKGSSDMLIGFDDGTLFWRAKQGESGNADRWLANAHKDAVGSVATSDGGEFALSGGFDGWVHFWKRGRLKPYHSSQFANQWIQASTYSEKHKQFVTGSSGGSVVIWDLKGKQIAKREVNGGITSLAFHPEQHLVAIGTLNGLLIWNPISNDVNELNEIRNQIKGLMFTQNGKRLLSSERTEFHYWDTESWAKIETINTGARIQVIQVVGDRYALIAGADGRIQTWDLRSREFTQKLYAHEDVITGMRYTEKAGLLSSSIDGQVRVWAIIKTDRK